MGCFVASLLAMTGLGVTSLCNSRGGCPRGAGQGARWDERRSAARAREARTLPLSAAIAARAPDLEDTSRFHVGDASLLCNLTFHISHTMTRARRSSPDFRVSIFPNHRKDIVVFAGRINRPAPGWPMASQSGGRRRDGQRRDRRGKRASKLAPPGAVTRTFGNWKG